MTVLGSPPTLPLAAVVGGGPAGLRAAEVLAAGGGCRVELFEGKPSVGRKFLVAGRGGLNLTHSESLDRFAARYADGDDPTGARWAGILRDFSPDDLRAWAAGLGVETYVGTSGRVFPRGQRAAALLRRWVARLRGAGVAFHVNHRWESLDPLPGGGWQIGFRLRESGGEERRVETAAGAVVFALGGASWPQTGSDGGWTAGFAARLGLRVAPWQPANCGWEVAWREEFLRAADGLPLKNIALSAGDRTVAGEALVTRYGLEGGALYQLGGRLRAMDRPRLTLDFKPTLTVAQLDAKLPIRGRANDANMFGLDEVAARWRLGAAARALLEFHGPGRAATRGAWLEAVKRFPLALRGPRPIAEAISSAGGLAWEEIEETTLGLRRLPGVFAAGEMLDWEAPTGGYLLQGCFATGTRAGRAAGGFLKMTNDE